MDGGPGAFFGGSTIGWGSCVYCISCITEFDSTQNSKLEKLYIQRLYSIYNIIYTRIPFSFEEAEF